MKRLNWLQDESVKLIKGARNGRRWPSGL